MKFNIKRVQYRNFDRCKECGGKCCKIYDNDFDGIRDKSEWFEDWCENFHTNAETYGVEPLFDPLDIHMTGHEVKWNELVTKGIDPYFCQYVGSDGCRIPWEKRPLHCRIFKCEKFTDDDIVREEEG